MNNIIQQEALSVFKERALVAAQRIFSKQRGISYPEIFLAVRERMENLLGRKDLVAYQRVVDNDLAQLVADNYVQTVIIEIDKDGLLWDEAPSFDDYLTRKFGVIKVIVAAGKSTRVSQSGLIHKQILRADGYNTSIKLVRASAAFGNLKDVVVIDYVSAYHIFKNCPIKNDVRNIILSKIEQEFEGIIQKRGKSLEAFSPLHVKILDILRENLLSAASLQKRRDTAETTHLIADLLLKEVPFPSFAEYLLDEIVYIIFKELVEREEYIDEAKRDDILGGNCIIALAKPYGPGEAYMAGVERLKTLDPVSAAKYTIPVYSDYTTALLSEYPNIYFHAYLQALSYFNLNGKEKFIVDRLPVITIGGKSPLDKVKDRGNIILVDTLYGVVPDAIKEWRDMTPQEQKEAEVRLEESRRTGKSAHALNAGVFIINTKWAMEKFPILRERFNHPDEKKGKLFEYWYTDLVKIAAEEYLTEREKNPEAPPRSRVVFLGEDAPSGIKDIPRALEFKSNLHHDIRDYLISIGITVDEGAKVSIGNQNADFEFERDLKAIFGCVVEGEKIIDQIYIFGDVHLETSVRVENGTILDGRGGNEVVLRGNTVVGSGVGLIGVVAVDSVFEGHPRLNGFSYHPPMLGDMGTYSKIISSCLKNTYVESGAEVIRTEATNCHIAGKAIDCELESEVVAADEILKNRTLQDKREKLSIFVKEPKKYVAGAFTLGERDEKNRDGIVTFVRKEISKLYEDTIPLLQARQDALKSTDALLNSALVNTLTSEHLYRYAFGKVRVLTEGDSFLPEKTKVIEAVKEFALKQLEGVLSIDIADEGKCRALFRELAILATKANFFDWQSESARNFFGREGFFDNLEANFEKVIARELGIDCLREYEELVFGSPGEFLYLVDNAGEVFFDAVLWLLFCRLGHTVIVAGKEKPIRSDATKADVQRIVDEIPVLKAFERKGKLRVISSGSDTYGVLLDKAPKEFEEAFTSTALKAVIAKGQGNLYTLSARNNVKAIVVAKLLSKGMTAEIVTGVPKKEVDGVTVYSPIIAVIPYGEHAIEPSEVKKGSFAGNLKKWLGSIY